MLKKHVKKKHGERRVWPGKETARKGDEKGDREIERERCQEKEISRDTGLKDASKENCRSSYLSVMFQWAITTKHVETTKTILRMKSKNFHTRTIYIYI
jgi:hypothetical protein